MSPDIIYKRQNPSQSSAVRWGSEHIQNAWEINPILTIIPFKTAEVTKVMTTEIGFRNRVQKVVIPPKHVSLMINNQ